MNKAIFALLTLAAPVNCRTAPAPRSANVHDSLAEGLLAKGDKAGAIVRYRKVLELEPGSAAARKKLEALEL